MTITDNRTPNFDIPLPHAGNEFPDDVARIIAAFTLIDVRLQEIVNQTQSPDAASISGQDLAFILALANATGVLPLSKGGTGGTDPASARTALGFDAAWDAKFAEALDALPAQLDTLTEMTAAIQANESVGAALNAAIAALQTAVDGKADQTALDTTDANVVTTLPDGAGGAFTLPRLTSAQIAALDMTGKAKGYKVHDTDLEQDLEWDGVSVWAPAATSIYQSGDYRSWNSFSIPSGWTDKGSNEAETGGAKFVLALLPSSFSSGHCCELSNGHILLYDQATMTAWTVNPATAVLTQTGTMQANGTGQVDAPLIPLPGNKAMLAGGRIFSGSTVLNTAQIYDFATNAWTATGNMPTAVWDPGFATDDAGNVFFFGGITNNSGTGFSNAVQKWTASAGTWSSRAAFSGTLGSISYPPCACLLPSGKFLVASHHLNGSTAGYFGTFDDTLNSHAVITHPAPSINYPFLAVEDFLGRGPMVTNAAAGTQYDLMFYNEVGDSWTYDTHQGVPSNTRRSAFRADGTVVDFGSGKVEIKMPTRLIQKD